MDYYLKFDGLRALKIPSRVSLLLLLYIFRCTEWQMHAMSFYKIPVPHRCLFKLIYVESVGLIWHSSSSTSSSSVLLRFKMLFYGNDLRVTSVAHLIELLSPTESHSSLVGHWYRYRSRLPKIEPISSQFEWGANSQTAAHAIIMEICSCLSDPLWQSQIRNPRTVYWNFISLASLSVLGLVQNDFYYHTFKWGWLSHVDLFLVSQCYYPNTAFLSLPSSFYGLFWWASHACDGYRNNNVPLFHTNHVCRLGIRFVQVCSVRNNSREPSLDDKQVLRIIIICTCVSCKDE